MKQSCYLSCKGTPLHAVFAALSQTVETEWSCVLLTWRRVQDSTSAAAEAGSRGKRATGTFSYTAPVRISSPLCKNSPAAGRTAFAWRRVQDSNPRGHHCPNGFQDRPVMTASVTLRIIRYIIVLDFLLERNPLHTGPPRYVLLRCPKSFARCSLARFRPLPLLFARFFRLRRRSQTSPLR